MVFFKNFILDFALLIVLNKALKVSGTGFHLFLGAFTGGMAGIFPYLFPFSLPYSAVIFLEYIIFPLLVVKIAFCQKRWKDFLKTTGFFWGVNFFAGGLLQFLYGKFPFLRENSYPMLTLFTAMLFACMFLGKGIEVIRDNFLEKRIYLPVILRIGGKSIAAMGLMDTGNQLKEPISKKPVIIMERELLEKEGISIPETNFYAIPYHSLGNKAGLLQGFIADEIVIGKEHDLRKIEQVMIGLCEEKLSMKGDYSLILNPML